MNLLKLSSSLIGLLVASNVYATTWSVDEVDDPINSEKKCKVGVPMSHGSYVYDWESKYDMVFWPLTAEQGIWHCEDSGFTAFIGDFESLTDLEKKQISVYLKENFQGDSDTEAKLKLLEDIYSFRERDSVFRNKLIRVLARRNQELGNIQKANDYRMRSFKEIQELLKTEINQEQKLEYLYLAANYSRQFDAIAESDEYIIKLKGAIDNLQDKELSGFTEYLTELIEETKFITAGGKLDPPQDSGE